MSNFDRSVWLNVKGFGGLTTRRDLQKKFSEFGKVTKLYIPEDLSYASIYFETIEQTEAAYRGMQNNSLCWQVEKFQKKQAFTKQTSAKASAMDLDQNFDYADIHGRPLVVLVDDEEGEVYISLKDIRQTGFSIIRRDNFQLGLLDKKKFLKEFEIYMLTQAKEYLIKNKVHCIKEDQIIETINKCKRMILHSDDENMEVQSNEMPNLGARRNDRKPLIDNGVNVRPNVLREPKTLPNNFLPTNRNPPQKTESARKTSGNTSFESNSSGRERRRIQSIAVERVPLGTERQKVQVVYVEPSKDNCCWVHLEKNEDTLEQLLRQITEIARDMNLVNEPSVNDVYIAMFEGGWYRVIVQSLSPLTVKFIDYGNVERVKCVKTIPDKLKSIPAQAVRIKFATELTRPLKDGMMFDIMQKKQYDDGTYLVNYKECNTLTRSAPPVRSQTKVVPPKREPESVRPSFSQEPKKVAEAVEPAVNEPVKIVEEPVKIPAKKEPEAFFGVTENPIKLSNNDVVAIMGYDEDSETFSVRTRDTCTEFNELTSYILDLQKSGQLQGLKNVTENQMVLCGKDGYTGLYRGLVTAKNSSAITVNFIDVEGSEILTKASLRNVDGSIAVTPATLIHTTKFENLKKYAANTQCTDYLEKLISDKIKTKVVLSPKLDFLLPNENKLSNILQNMVSPQKKEVVEKNDAKVVQKEKEVVPKEVVKEVVQKPIPQSAKVKYDDMEFVTPTLGLKEYMFYSYKNIEQVTILSLEEKYTDILTTITELMDDVKDEVPYAPEECEMVLAAFKGPDEDAESWYRGVALEVNDDEFDILFVDYGNQQKLKSSALRRYPPALQQIPVLGIICQLEGLKSSKKLENRLKELLEDGATFDVNVISQDDDLKYNITIPQVYEVLKHEELI